MRILLWEQVRAMLVPQAALPAEGADHPVRERFPIPHTFKPQLGFFEAVIAVFGAFLRIFLGSLLFAVWGTYTMLAWSKLGNYFWRALVTLPMVALFLLTFTLLMLAISALVRTLSPKRR